MFVSWCNGSTTDFGSVCLGSNPGETTPEAALKAAFTLYTGILRLARPPPNAAAISAKARRIFTQVDAFVLSGRCNDRRNHRKQRFFI